MLNSYQFLELFYGEKWLGAASTFSILTIIGLLKTLAHPGGSLLLSKGRADIGFYWNCLWTFALYCSISLTLSYHSSIKSVALGQLLAGIIFGPLWHYIVMRYGKVGYLIIGIDMIKLLLFSFPAFGIVYLVNHLEIVNTASLLSVKIIIFSTAYVLFIFFFFKEKISNIIKIIK